MSTTGDMDSKARVGDELGTFSRVEAEADAEFPCHARWRSTHMDPAVSRRGAGRRHPIHACVRWIWTMSRRCQGGCQGEDVEENLRTRPIQVGAHYASQLLDQVLQVASQIA